ncbi:hypothetical protein KCH_76380 [Kitasatospora cheerisanensis KCTC 2395]|uniref:Uncharacterized protein n=1 Tax=Kitasatospora cheerisanensis KCTC 2395 TaxID=1348663 RepID=A0A066YKY3_9ACTN|nr:hypothetical protein KCH_76380 [Kitasatospora cheerisanensis KCTC 2395]
MRGAARPHTHGPQHAPPPATARGAPKRLPRLPLTGKHDLASNPRPGQPVRRPGDPSRLPGGRPPRGGTVHAPGFGNSTAGCADVRRAPLRSVTHAAPPSKITRTGTQAKDNRNRPPTGRQRTPPSGPRRHRPDHRTSPPSPAGRSSVRSGFRHRRAEGSRQRPSPGRSRLTRTRADSGWAVGSGAECQHLAGQQQIGVAADRVAVEGVEGRPSAGETELFSDATERVPLLHRPHTRRARGQDGSVLRIGPRHAAVTRSRPRLESVRTLGLLRRPAAAHRPRRQALPRGEALRHLDLLLPGRPVRTRRKIEPTIGAPGRRIELQTPVVAVPGIGVPAATALTMRHHIPVHTRHRARRHSDRRRRQQPAEHRGNHKQRKNNNGKTAQRHSHQRHGNSTTRRQKPGHRSTRNPIRSHDATPPDSPKTPTPQTAAQHPTNRLSPRPTPPNDNRTRRDGPTRHRTTPKPQHPDGRRRARPPRGPLPAGLGRNTAPL